MDNFVKYAFYGVIPDISIDTIYNCYLVYSNDRIPKSEFMAKWQQYINCITK